MLRVVSPLDDATEKLITLIIGCAIAVHKALGPGLLESIYRRALCIELAAAGLSFEVERQVPVTYRGTLLCHQRLDIIVEGQVLIEIKAVERLAPIHYAQVLCYLKVAAILPDGLKRVVL
jgi:GxxExxY protein